eukprot:2092103-Pyramimonas_sp.AAC.1
MRCSLEQALARALTFQSIQYGRVPSHEQVRCLSARDSHRRPGLALAIARLYAGRQPSSDFVSTHLGAARHSSLPSVAQSAPRWVCPAVSRARQPRASSVKSALRRNGMGNRQDARDIDAQGYGTRTGSKCQIPRPKMALQDRDESSG